MINVDKYKDIIDVKYPGMIECPPGWYSVLSDAEYEKRFK